jgi:ribose-phosphate pyrophosphokinase
MFKIKVPGFEGEWVKQNNRFLFPGGEIGVKLDSENYAFNHTTNPVMITARIHDAVDLFELALIQDAVKELVQPRTNIKLFMPYVPYGRQDRVCDKGEPFSLRVFANYINSLNFHSVAIVDPHSDVTPALINNSLVLSQQEIIGEFAELNKYIITAKPIFVSPDAGANKKTAALAKLYDHSSFIRCDKLRDLATGQIKETIVYADDLKGASVIICDDICDGGRTFIELAKALRAKNAGTIALYVTHGIFSKGTRVLIDGGIDQIFTTDSWGGETQWVMEPRVTVTKLEEIFYT